MVGFTAHAREHRLVAPPEVVVTLLPADSRKEKPRFGAWQTPQGMIPAL